MKKGAGAVPRYWSIVALECGRTLMRNLFVCLALALVASALFDSPPVQAGAALDQALRARCSKTTCTIRDNPGGDIQLFQAAAQEVLDEGKYLVIDGFCASACVILA